MDQKSKTDKKMIIPKLPPSEGEVKIDFPDGKSISLNLHKSTDNTELIDTRSLYAKSGYFTFDPGFVCTASCMSQITHVNGQNGKLTHRGYPIQDLVNNCTYLEVCYLLLYGELPTKAALAKFENTVTDEMCIHENMIRFYDCFEKDSHPMAIMVGMVGAMSAFNKSTEYILDEKERQVNAVRLISKMPMIAALAFRTSKGLPIVYPKKKYGYIENLLRMMFKDRMDKWKCDEKIIKLIEKIFILHADHGQGPSTTTVRIATSSYANPYACISSGIASLWGPAHGGADEAVVDMLREIGDVENIKSFLDKVKEDKNIRLMGFGHRVYKVYDPRAVIMKELATEVISLIGDQKERKLLDIAFELEKQALADDYFVKRSLYPNIDFYTGLIYSCLGIPKNMFTVMFSISRSVGWVSNMLEFTSDAFRIGRPRQLYVGKEDREFVTIDKRESQDLCIDVPKQSGIFKLPIQ